MPSNIADELYQAVLDGLIDAQEGVGFDYVHPDEKLDYPMARALVAAAESRYQRNPNSVIRAERNATWLCEHADRDDDGVIGWGLPFEWNTNIQGVTYSAHQETTITTAICIDGLLTAYEHLDEHSEYLDTAVAAAETFIDCECYSEYDDELCFWYTAAGEAPSDTINSHAYLVGQLQRLTSYSIGTSRKRLFSDVADRGVRYLLSERRNKSEESGWLWNHYGRALPPDRDEHAPQDILHTAYTVDGMLTYNRYEGELKDHVDNGELIASFKNYYSAGFYSRYVGQELRWSRLGPRYIWSQMRRLIQTKEIQSPSAYRESLCARLWGLGHALTVASAEGANSVTEDLISDLDQSRDQLRMQRSRPTARGVGAVRHLAHILNGLSVYQTRL
jgi:hypothetical protein